MYSIVTLGSHTALQILKGAKDEGFTTLSIVTPQQENLYRRFDFIDEILTLPSFRDFPSIEKELQKRKAIIVPHGSFVSYLGLVENKKMKVKYFGNKTVLDWEADREKQHQWLNQAGLLLPRQFSKEEPIDSPVIVKSFGAAGGRGYFVAKNKKELNKKIHRFGDNPYIIQEYVIGVPLYIHYFYSTLSGKLEILGIDRRYETNVDSIGRIPAYLQDRTLEPSFVVVGNLPLVLRESMLEEAFTMGEDVVATSRELIDKRGLFGPFCLETIITSDQRFYCIEISCRIVAGTNLYISGSPYSSYIYNEPMSMGRRIAREIKEAIRKKRLAELLD